MYENLFDTKISNLMILDNSGLDYARMLKFAFGFPVYCKISPNYPAFSRLRQHVDYKAVTST